MLKRQHLGRNRLKFSSGSSQNYFGESAWPNDLLYIFPVCIVGLIVACLSFGLLEPTGIGERSDPFSTPLEILPEWYFFSTFNLLRIVPNKVLGVSSMVILPNGIGSIQNGGSCSNLLNLSRRPVDSGAHSNSSITSSLSGLGATQALGLALEIGL